MDATEKKQALEKVFLDLNNLNFASTRNPNFISWKMLCERTLIKIYGANSKELEQFKELKFDYEKGKGSIFSMKSVDYFKRDLGIAIKMIQQLYAEIDEENDELLKNSNIDSYSKLFISHSKKDKSIIVDIIDMIEAIGLNASQIFCSSVDGYGIPLGSNFLEILKKEISNDVFVVFVLTNNFYKSPFCLCEMGASWVLSKEHIPIIVPPFKYDDVKGVIPNTQGFIINEELKWNLFRDLLIKKYKINEESTSNWERKRDSILKKINRKISSPKYAKS